jgi:hypothetical protein
MDYEKRTPVIPKDHGIFVADGFRGELPLPGPCAAPAEESFSRAVLYSETDERDMNNSRYLDWADDCLAAISTGTGS